VRPSSSIPRKLIILQAMYPFAFSLWRRFLASTHMAGPPHSTTSPTAFVPLPLAREIPVSCNSMEFFIYPYPLVGFNFGILLIWVMMSCVSLVLLQWFVRLRAIDKSHAEKPPRSGPPGNTSGGWPISCFEISRV